MKGIVESFSKSTHGLKVAGKWYNNKFKDFPSEMKVGSEVEFDVKNDKFWENIKVVNTPSNGTGSSVRLPQTKQGWRPPSEEPFPLKPDDGRRSMVRSNALGHAVALVVRIIDASVTLDEAVDQVIQVAQKLEEYSSGDLETKLAKQSLNDSFDLPE